MLADVNSTAIATWLMSSQWLAYGAGPVLAAFLGFIVPYIFVCVLEATGLIKDEHAIDYSKKRRKVALHELELKISIKAQLRASIWTTLGPGALSNGFLSALVLPHLFPALSSLHALPDLHTFIRQFCVMQLVGDLGLYAGHRLQHENEFLWKHYHSVHHSIDTPCVSSTAYIDAIDMTLQTALPMMLAAVASQAHPVSFLIYIFARVGENALNHCGYDHWLINFVSLKWLPGKASVRHHDQHHKYSNYGPNAKNYAENYIFWDWLFGTLRSSACVC
jgi:sterol desaturase/sphingolipid hydroxylase (fatty acid hydroxylase superfamily)